MTREEAAKLLSEESARPAAPALSKSQKVAKGLGDVEPGLGGVGGSMAGAAIGAQIGAFGGPAAPVTIPLGALAGGFAGGAGFGALGQKAREATYRSAGLGQAPGTAAGAAKEQGILGLFGELLSLGGRAAGWGLVRSGVVGKGAAIGKAVGEMIHERLPVGGTNRLSGLIPAGARKIPIVGPSLVRGGKAAEANYGAALGARDAANAAAGAKGASVPAAPLDAEFQAMSADFSKRSDSSRQLAALNKRYEDFVNAWKSGGLAPKDAQTFLTSLDEEAKPLWEARDKNKYVPRADQIVAQQAKRLSAVLREQMRTIVKGHEVTSAKLSRAIAAKSAIGASEETPGIMKAIGRGAAGATVGAAVGGLADEGHPWAGRGAGAAIGTALLSSPAGASRLGLLLSDPAVQMLLRQGPRFFHMPQDQTRTK